MNALVQVGLTNAVMAGGLAIIAAFAGKLFRRPALTHALWLLVLLKLITPPLIVIPIGQVEAETIDLPTLGDRVEAPDAIEPIAPYAEPRQKQRWRKPKAAVEPVSPPPLMSPDVFAPVPVPIPEPTQVDEPAQLPSLQPEVPSASDSPQAESAPIWTLPELPWLSIFGGVWFAGSLAWFFIALRRVARFHRVLSMGREAPKGLQRQASELAIQMGLSDCPVVWVVPGTVSPLLWAIAGYPKLLIPAGLLGRLDDTQCQSLLAHELAHYRRRDHWVRCLEFVALGLYWWCPVVWWARRELREAEEECCDGWVLWTLPRAAKSYADALVETLDFLSGTRPALPPAASGLGQLDLLRRRLTMIMRGRTSRSLGGLGFLAVLGLGVLLLPTLPSWAQQVTPEPAPQAQGKGGGGGKKSMDVDQARAELERALAELEQLKARLRAMQADAEFKALTIQRTKEELKRVEQDVLKQKFEVAKKKDKKDQKDFVIGGFGTGGAQLNRDQIRKLLESMDGKAREEQIKILMKHLEKGAGGKGGPPGTFGFQPAVGELMAKKGLPPVPAVPAVSTKGAIVAKSGGGDIDRRLASLENKVDQILNELTAMRKGGAPKDGKKDKKGKKDGGFEPPTPPNPPLPPTFGGGKAAGAGSGQGGGGAKGSGSGQGGGGGGGGVEMRLDRPDSVPPTNVTQPPLKKGSR